MKKKARSTSRLKATKHRAHDVPESLPETDELPILPRSGIFLTAPMGYDGDRFKAAFIRAWNTLPRKARATLAGGWREFRPLISIRAERWGEKSECTFATTNDWHNVKFWQTAIDLLPLSVLEILIVHELVHVHFLLIDPDNARSEDIEDRVAAAMKGWGVSQKRFDNWVKKHLAMRGEKVVKKTRRKVSIERLAELFGISKRC